MASFLQTHCYYFGLYVMSLLFSCCSVVSLDLHQNAFSFGRTSRSTQHNTMPYNFSLWQLVSDECISVKSNFKCEKNSTFHHKLYFIRKIITAQCTFWTFNGRKHFCRKTEEKEGEETYSHCHQSASPSFYYHEFSFIFNVEHIRFHSVDFICTFPLEKLQCEINYSHNKIAATSIQGNDS